MISLHQDDAAEKSEDNLYFCLHNVIASKVRVRRSNRAAIAKGVIPCFSAKFLAGEVTGFTQSLPSREIIAIKARTHTNERV